MTTQADAVEAGRRWAGQDVRVRRLQGGWLVVPTGHAPQVRMGVSLAVVDDEDGAVIEIGAVPPPMIQTEFERARARARAARPGSPPDADPGGA